MDDSALVEGLRRQDPEAVQQLTDCYLPTVWRFVYAKVNRDEHLAEDLVSEAILALIKAVSDPELEIRNVGGWLRTVASNKVMDHFRSAARVQHLIDEVQKTAPVSDDNDAVMQKELEERRLEIRNVMNDLPQQTQFALEWKYVEKLSVREIAARLQTTEKATESILFRGRREFRERLVRRDEQAGAREPRCAGTSGVTPPSERTTSNTLNTVHGHPMSADQSIAAKSAHEESEPPKAERESLEAAKLGRS